MPIRLATVTRRPAEPRDDVWLGELFAESRPEMAMLPPDMRDSILDLQVRAQRQQYAASYPDATEEIVVADGVDVGRLICNDDATAVRIVDVTVRESHRGQGIGSKVLREVLDDAASRGLPVRLSVWSANSDARRLYQRLGFAVVGSSDGYDEMQRDVAREGTQ